MDSFLENNRQKLGFVFKTTSFIFLTIVFICLVIGYYNDQLPTIGLFIFMILFAGLGFPIYIIGLLYLNWRSITRKRKKVYNIFPFEKLEEIGFEKLLIKQESKSNFTEEIKAGQINNYFIKCDIDSGFIYFTALIGTLNIDRKEYKVLKARLKGNSIYFNSEGIAKIYRIKEHNLKSILELDHDLIQFTNLLKQENIQPL